MGGARAAGPPVRVGLLGSLDVTVGGTPVSLGGSRQRAVLAVLALHAGTPVRPERLISMLWDDDPPPAAANTLQVYVSRLRRALAAGGAGPSSVLVTVAGSYLLRLPDDAVDVARFESLAARGHALLVAGDAAPAADLLRKALSLWRGSPLPDLTALAAGHSQVARLEALRQAALADRIDADAASGRHTELVPELEDLVRQRPLDERLVAQLMIALCGAGRQADALSVHAVVVRRLAGELGLDPGPALRRAHQRVLRQDVVPPPLPAPREPPGEAGDFVGRQDELAAVLELLSGPGGRLVCVLGPGGAGKTRLATEAVARSGPRALLVPLSHVDAADDILPELCRALGAEPDWTGEPALDTVTRAVTGQPGSGGVPLLVLDNLEQIDGCDQVVAALLDRVPHLKVVVTSRIALGLSGEHVLPLGPLPLPAPGTSDVGVALESAAVRLFRDRAARALPGFAVGERNVLSVCELCRRLEGLPLALELAAARVAMLPPDEMLRRLDPRMQLLAGGSQQLPERHRSIWAAIDWSVRLLDPAERQVFAQLSTFAAGWDLAAAESVCAETCSGEAVLDVLDRLHRRSLLVADGTGRMSMLDTIRTHAAELLAGSPDLLQVTRVRHARWFTELAEELGPLSQPWRSADDAARRALLTLTRESANLAAALDFSASSAGAGNLLGRLVSSLVDHWYATGRVSTADRWVQAAQRSALPAPTRVRLLLTLGNLALARADLPAAREVLAQAHAGAVALGDTALVVRSLAARAVEVRYGGDPAAALAVVTAARSAAAGLGIGSLDRALATEAGELLDELSRTGEAVALWQQVLDAAAADDDPVQAAFAQIGLARVAAEAGEPDVASVYLAEARDGAGSVGQAPVLSDVLAACALLDLPAGRAAEAASQLTDAVRLALECGQLLGLPELTGLLGAARLACGDVAVGARLLGAAQAWRIDRGVWPASRLARAVIDRAGADLAAAAESDRRLPLERARGARARFGSLRGMAALDPALPGDGPDQGLVIDLRPWPSFTR